MSSTTRRRGQDLPRVRRRPRRVGGAVRGERRGRGHRAALRHQAPQAQEVPLPLRQLHRDRAGAATPDRGRAVLGRLRDHRRHRQVPHAPAARTTGGRDGAARARVDSQTLFNQLWALNRCSCPPTTGSATCSAPARCSSWTSPAGRCWASRARAPSRRSGTSGRSSPSWASTTRSSTAATRTPQKICSRTSRAT